MSGAKDLLAKAPQDKLRTVRSDGRRRGGSRGQLAQEPYGPVATRTSAGRALPPIRAARAHRELPEEPEFSLSLGLRWCPSSPRYQSARSCATGERQVREDAAQPAVHLDPGSDGQVSAQEGGGGGGSGRQLDRRSAGSPRQACCVRAPATGTSRSRSTNGRAIERQRRADEKMESVRADVLQPGETSMTVSTRGRASSPPTLGLTHRRRAGGATPRQSDCGPSRRS
jgi:hypothetical protein